MIHSRIDKPELFKLFSDVLASGNYSEGGMVAKLEASISSIYDQFAVSFNSAGTALYSVVRVLGCKKVIVPNNTFFATGGMPKEAGCEVTLADCSRTDLSLSVKSITEVFDNHDTVILTHVGGGMAHEYEAIAKWCDANGVMLIEDAAHTFGVTKPHKPGSLSHAAVFSFYPTKAVPVGEGGMVVTRSPELSKDLAMFRNYGKYKSEGAVAYTGAGLNFRMDEWTSAVALHQVGRLGEIMERRGNDAAMLSAIFQPIVTWEQTNWYKFITLDSIGREYIPVRRTGMVYQRSDQLRNIKGFSTLIEMPESDFVADNYICLPVGEGMYEGMSSDQVVDYVRGV